MGTQGHFVWFDLVNEDGRKAKPFYSQAVGWKSKAWDGDGGSYEMWTAAGDTPMGGLMAAPELPKKPTWVGYVSVDSVDAALERAQRMGGKVLLSKGMPNGGKYAVLTDPQGAQFGLYQSPQAGTVPDVRALGQVGWSELRTTDWQAAMKFYGELLGWQVSQTMNMGPELGDYVMFGPDKNPDSMFGGMSNTARVYKMPAHWLYYANVSDTDGAAKKVPLLGGQVRNGPMDVPGGSRVAECVDPEGAAFGIMTPGKPGERTAK